MKYNMDSHKLMYHPDVLTKWLKGEYFIPVTIEISPSGACNLRCKFCSQAFQGYKPQMLNSRILLENELYMKEHGLKSVVFAGEGEPLLNSDIGAMIRESYNMGIDVGISTNATLFDRYFSKNYLKYLTWVRVSLNGTGNVYDTVHGTDPTSHMYDRVLTNIINMVSIKRQNNYPCTIGVQLVLLPENYHSVVDLAVDLRKIGVDYFSVKPFSKLDKNSFDIPNDSFIWDISNLKKQLEKNNDENFSIIIRDHAFNCIHQDKKYNKCLGIPFWAYIASNGDVWPCLAYIGDEDFKYGNLYNASFREIWGSDRAKSLQTKMANMDISFCRKACRLDSINEYLQELLHPIEHKNFI